MYPRGSPSLRVEIVFSKAYYPDYLIGPESPFQRRQYRVFKPEDPYDYCTWITSRNWSSTNIQVCAAAIVSARWTVDHLLAVSLGSDGRHSISSCAQKVHLEDEVSSRLRRFRRDAVTLGRLYCFIAEIDYDRAGFSMLKNLKKQIRHQLLWAQMGSWRW